MFAKQNLSRDKTTILQPARTVNLYEITTRNKLPKSELHIAEHVMNRLDKHLAQNWFRLNAVQRKGGKIRVLATHGDLHNVLNDNFLRKLSPTEQESVYIKMVKK